MSEPHVQDEDLVLDYYGELDVAGRAALRAHLSSCPQCQRVDQDLRATLRLVDVAPPVEAPPNFERDVWAHIAPRLTPAPVRAWAGWSWPRLAWATAAAAALVVAFFAGRAGRPAVSTGEGVPPAYVASTRERLLDAEVEDHLERSQRVLSELVNADVDQPVSVTADRARAADLVAAGRVYRQSADTAGDAAMSDLLDDLQRVLLDVANGPTNPTPGELRDVRQRIDQQDLVFRLRVVTAALRQRQGRGQPGI